MKQINSNLSSLASIGVACWLRHLNDNMRANDAIAVASHALHLAYHMYTSPGEQINIAVLHQNGSLVWIDDLKHHDLSNVVYLISVRHSLTDGFLYSTGVIFTRKRVFLHATPIAIRDRAACAIGSFADFIQSFPKLFCTTGERVRDRETSENVSPYIKTLPLR